MATVPKLLIACPQCDGNDVGETHSGHEWVSRLARLYDVTLLTLRLPGRVPPSEQIPHARVVEWKPRLYFPRYPRFNGSAKPWYPHFYLKARQWIGASLASGEHFDLMHQVMPLAMRYPTPCAGFSVPFVVGPVGGSVATPPGFRDEMSTEPLFLKLRELDPFRLSHDPLLRRTYEDAAGILCGPYLVDAFAPLKPRRVKIEFEVGLARLPDVAPRPERTPGTLKMLFVGRVIRTKGLRDAIRAMGRLGDLPGVTLDVAGAGEDMAACRDEAQRLGVADRVRFLGRLPRADIDALYRNADVFLFPSFREATGNVMFEAMSFGLPVITAARGGPGHIVTDGSGFRIEPDTPESYADGIAAAVRRLAGEPALVRAMSAAARERIAELGLWDRKIARLTSLYEEILAGSRASAAA